MNWVDDLECMEQREQLHFTSLSATVASEFRWKNMTLFLQFKWSIRQREKSAIIFPHGRVISGNDFSPACTSATRPSSWMKLKDSNLIREAINLLKWWWFTGIAQYAALGLHKIYELLGEREWHGMNKKGEGSFLWRHVIELHFLDPAKMLF